MVAVTIQRKKATGFENVTDIIQIRPPKARDLFGLNFLGEHGMKSFAVLISRCSSLTLEEVEDLDAEEFFKLQIEISKLLGTVS